MKSSGLSRALWLAWHPWELLRVIVVGFVVAWSYVQAVIDEAQK